jgi:hypothetical protein
MFSDILKHIKSGKNHSQIPIGELDLENFSGQGKVGYRIKTSKFLKQAEKWMRHSNPIVQNMNDFVQWYFWDRTNIAAGANVPVKTQLFTVPMNQGGKTKVDTNLEQPMKINSPGWMNVFYLGLYFGTATLLLDITNLTDQSYIEFWVSQKIYVEGHAVCFPSGTGLKGVTTDTAQQTYTNGEPSITNYFDLRIPRGIDLGVDNAGNAVVADGLMGVSILPDQTFHVDLLLPGGVLALTAAAAVPNAGVGLKMYSYLVGTYSRGVQ